MNNIDKLLLCILMGAVIYQAAVILPDNIDRLEKRIEILEAKK